MLTRSTRRDAPAVNAGSMADIAFLLLIFFLVTTTITEENGVLVRLPPWVVEPPLTPSSQVLTVIVNADDQLLVEEQATQPADLPRAVYDFVRSPKRTPKQAVVSLIHDRSTTYNRQYGKGYAMLDEVQQRGIRAEIPMILSEAEPNDALGN